MLVYAFRRDAGRHAEFRNWLYEQATAQGPFAFSELVASGFLRLVTHPRAFNEPSAPAVALRFLEALRDRPNCVVVAPRARHWDIFTRLVREAGARGNLVPDAYLAALAIESGSEWITTDRDYARFPGLRWRHPLAG